MTAPRALPEVPGEIVTERLVLRRYREADAEAVIAAINESRAELDPWMDWSPSMREPNDAVTLARRSAEAWAAREDFGLGIFLRDGGRYLGGTGLHRPNWRVPSLEIGYWMRTSEVGNGYVREAVIALTKVGFGRLGLRRMEIRCAVSNDRSRRVAESAGYVFEGRLRNHDRLPNGELRDTVVFALVDSDETVQRLLEAGDDISSTG